MIAIEADFNHLDGSGRLVLSDLVIHQSTPFAEVAALAAAGESILFVDGGECVAGSLVRLSDGSWTADVDWSTQQLLRAYPPDRAVLTTIGR